MSDITDDVAPPAAGRAYLLTPPGAGAIAVVRLRGQGVATFLAKHFDSPIREGHCVHATLRDGERQLDDPVVVVSEGGTVADVSLHGGPWVVRSMADLVRREGFEWADRCENPSNEVALDAATAVESEVEQYLPLAPTELAVRALLAQPAAWGELERAGISRDRAATIAADRSLFWLLHAPTVAVVGVPNAGKSTLANQLYARERAITADVAGTTRDWVGETANLDGLAVTLIDTPGVRETGDAVESAAIGRSRERLASADLVVLVLDPTQPREPEQRRLERSLPAALRVINKADRAGAWHDDSIALRTAATAGTGIDVLRRTIRDRFIGAEPFDQSAARAWTPRQRKLLERIAGGVTSSTSASRCPGK